MLLAFATVGPAPAAERVTSETAAEEASRIGLWPGGLAPGDVPLDDAPRIVERSADPAVPDRAISRVAEPYLVVYRPQWPDGSALLVTPGGGYARVVLDKEGTTLVPAFVEEAGVTLFVLRYRLPGEGHPEQRDVPLADAQRAMRLIRAHAAEHDIDPHRVGVMRFSAGCHVAASLATRFDAQVYPAVDAADAQSARPDLQILAYPVIDMGSEIAHAGSRDTLLGESPSPALVHAYTAQNTVRADAPPAFLLHAQDDDVVPVGNSLAYAQALLEKGVPAELHLFPRGGHGFGVRGTDGLTVAAWPRLAIAWMRWQYAQREGRGLGAPFAATGELVAGLWLWQVRDMDEAVEWVKRCPNPMPGPSEIEIRPLFEMEDFGDALPPEVAGREARPCAEVAAAEDVRAGT